LIVGGAEFHQAGHAADTLGQNGEPVVTDVQVPEMDKPRHRGRQQLEFVVVKVKKIAESLEVAECIRQLLQVVVPEIQHAELFEGSDLLRNAGEIVIGQYQRLKMGLGPNGIRYATEPAFP
jgi:hypothetical protein